MENQLFNADDIQVFTPQDIDGKALKIKTSTNTDGTIMTGTDIETGKIYVLSIDIKQQDTQVKICDCNNGWRKVEWLYEKESSFEFKI